jgi:hypothetical protein
MITILDSIIEILEVLLVLDLFIFFIVVCCFVELKFISGLHLKIGSWCFRKHQSGK